MRFIALTLFVVATATCYLDVDDLVNSAEEAGAPFTENALKKIRDNGLWGAKAQYRSSDVVIINTSRQDFILNHTKCFRGGFSTDLWPDSTLNGKSSIVYRIESYKYLQGVQCNIEYESTNNFTWFSLMIDNPFLGDSNAYAFSSWDLTIHRDVSAGHNNQVKFALTENDCSRPSSSSAQARGLLPKKPKGNPNELLKISTSGSRSRKI